MEAIDYGYRHWHIERSGPEEGPPVVILHGWGSHSGLMRPLADALSDQYRVYNIDLPGHGHSPQPPEPWGVPDHGAAVAEFITEEIGEPVVLVGHSNGGRIGFYMASEPVIAPLIAGLALISPSGVPRLPNWRSRARSGAAKALKAPFQAMPDPWRGRGLDWLRHTVYWDLLSSSDYSRVEGVMRETFVKTVNYHVVERLEDIEVPVLVFWGDRDEAVTREQMVALEHYLPDMGLVVLEDAGHYGHLDAPAAVIGGIRHFLSETLAETAPASDAANN
jgi:pimeloyl-ACP methyl ester carboxylesterase